MGGGVRDLGLFFLARPPLFLVLLFLQVNGASNRMVRTKEAKTGS